MSVATASPICAGVYRCHRYIPDISHLISARAHTRLAKPEYSSPVRAIQGIAARQCGGCPFFASARRACNLLARATVWWVRHPLRQRVGRVPPAFRYPVQSDFPGATPILDGWPVLFEGGGLDDLANGNLDPLWRQAVPLRRGCATASSSV